MEQFIQVVERLGIGIASFIVFVWLVRRIVDGMSLQLEKTAVSIQAMVDAVKSLEKENRTAHTKQWEEHREMVEHCRRVG